MHGRQAPPLQADPVEATGGIRGVDKGRLVVTLRRELRDGEH